MNGLRPRQVRAIADVTEAYRTGHKSPIMVAPTGFGKTHTSAEIIRRAISRGRRVWFLAHLKEILDATAGKLRDERIQHGFIMAGRLTDRRHQVQIVSVQTAVRRLDQLEKPDLIIIDEAHLAVAATYQTIIEWAGPECWRLLLTATPVRLDGRGMREVADCIVNTCTTGELIDEGLLAPIKYYAPSGPDLSGVSSLGGDFNQGQLAKAMDKPKITGSAVSHYAKLARNRPAVAFCVSVEHAQHVAQEFTAAGFRAVAISGDSDPIVRDSALKDLQAGRIDVVCNCQLWVAGVDAPAVSCIIQLAPTQSLVKYLQSIGRGLRTHPGKDCCIVLDHAGNSERHGSPLMEREWSLDAKAKRKGTNKSQVPVKTCPSCYRTVAAAATDCVCGHHFAPVAREIEQVEGNLVEQDLRAVQAARRVEQGRAQTEEDLIAIGRSRGMKRPELWARHVIRARHAKQARVGL
jgi:DNA repair protein RadD